jgi:serine kinase of HPr protein (carbohydrate metabolism regulator)
MVNKSISFNCHMTVEEISKLLDAEIICGKNRASLKIDLAFASDLMSDVLTLGEDNVMLITGLANMQTIRTAEMAEIPCVIVARDKEVSDEMTEIAEENGIILLKCRYSVFKTCGLLFREGISPIF